MVVATERGALLWMFLCPPENGENRKPNAQIATHLLPPPSSPLLLSSSVRVRFLRRHRNPILTLGLLPTSSQQQANARGMEQTQLCGVQIPLPNFQKGGRGLKCIELCARFFHPSLALMKAAARMIRGGGGMNRGMGGRWNMRDMRVDNFSCF